MNPALLSLFSGCRGCIQSMTLNMNFPIRNSTLWICFLNITHLKWFLFVRLSEDWSNFKRFQLTPSHFSSVAFYHKAPAPHGDCQLQSHWPAGETSTKLQSPCEHFQFVLHQLTCASEAWHHSAARVDLRAKQGWAGQGVGVRLIV